VNASKKLWVRNVLGMAAATAVLGTALAQQGPVKIGLLATLEGPFAAGGADAMRGAEMAVKQRGATVAGRRIEIIKASSDAKPDVAVNATRKLVEQDKVDIMVGPLSGGEGIAVKDYSKTQPNVTFLNGSSGAQAATLVSPSPNFFRFNQNPAFFDARNILHYEPFGLNFCNNFRQFQSQIGASERFIAFSRTRKILTRRAADNGGNVPPRQPLTGAATSKPAKPAAKRLSARRRQV